MSPSDGDTSSAATAVKEILAADDHYAAIKASRSMSTTELRRCYLKASVQVHPDKNKHPDATKAFQRVAAAWAVLGNEGRRSRYDCQLRRGRVPRAGSGSLSDDSSDDERELSPEEAFAAFAFATAACFSSTGGGFGDVAETLFWAQQLGQLGQLRHLQQAYQEQQRRQHGTPQRPSPQESWYPQDWANPMAPSPELAGTASGMAFTAGLWAAGTVASFAGLPRIGSVARRVAAVQGVTQLAMASQIPGVKEQLEAKMAVAAEQVQWMAGAIKNASTAAGAKARAAVEEVRDALGGEEGPLRESCIPKIRWRPTFAVQREEAPAAVPASAAAPAAAEEAQALPASLAPGTWVRLSGLRVATDLEGRIGEVVGLDPKGERYQVRLASGTAHGVASGGLSSGAEGQVKLIKRENLFPAAERSRQPPRAAEQFI